MTEESGADGKTLTKVDIVESVHRKTTLSKKVVTEIVEKIFETIKKTLSTGEHVKISGFGKFEIRSKRARRGRNPQTGAAIEISPRNVLSFKASQILRDLLLEKVK